MPKYQNLSHYSSLQDNLDNIPISSPTYINPPHSSSFQDNLDSTIDSHDSDFEMLPNPLYYSHPPNKCFPQFFPRVADSPDAFSSPSLVTPNESPYKRAPHSPYNLRSLPLQHYNSSKPHISFPP